MKLTPNDKARTLAVLREHLPSITYLKHKPGAHAWLAQLLQEAEALCMAPIDFKLCNGGRLTVDGAPIPHPGKGLMLAWLTLAGMQYRHDPLRPEWVFPGRRWSASAVQALDRAVSAVKPISPALANVIDALGVHRGELVMKENAQVRVRCTLDDTLVEVLRRMA